MSDKSWIEHPLVKPVLKTLLQDKTTKESILFATDDYLGFGDDYGAEMNMTEELLLQISQEIQPRVAKSIEAQKNRTKVKAEVMTPPWIVCLMNGHCDADWFGRENVFERLDGQQWVTTPEPVRFPETKKHSWCDYVDCRRMEITCGEAPFIVSRYDTTTGEPIPIERRVGFLDHKLRVVNENTQTEEAWFKWTVRAFQSCYGFEFQGDNLLIARINLLLTFVEYMEAQWHRLPKRGEVQRISTIIAWNLWQMDAFTGTIPFGELEKEKDPWEQMSLFELPPQEEIKATPPCLIRDWRATGVGGRALMYFSLKGENKMSNFFWATIGNPPYQEERQGDSNTATPVYHSFMDEAYRLSEKTMLITPARFLFNAGYTPKSWNQKMLDDKHLKVMTYFPDSKSVFQGVDIKGGVVVTYRDEARDFGAIRIFTRYPEINEILHKVLSDDSFSSIKDIIVTSFAYHYTKALYVEHPELKGRASQGHDYDVQSNAFSVFPEVFFDAEPNNDDYIRILGKDGSGRCFKYIKRRYIANVPNLESYKVFYPKATGTGQFGEVLPDAILGKPGDGNTVTFLSIGSFKTANEVKNCIAYTRTKFARALLSVLKVTQDNTPGKWAYVPDQNFSSSSDINWKTSIANIDRQLYKKYGLSPEEIAFIESHVKEME